MKIPRLKKLIKKDGLIFLDEEYGAVMITYSKEDEGDEWWLYDYPHTRTSQPIEQSDLKTMKLYGPIEVVG